MSEFTEWTFDYKNEYYHRERELPKSVLAQLLGYADHNVLLVGMVNHGEGVRIHDKPTFNRDQSRILLLREHFAGVYTLAPSRSLRANENHIDHKLNPRAVPETVEKLRGKKLDYILLEYVHNTKSYYCEHLLIGSVKNRLETNAGNNLRLFIEGLIRKGALNPGCKLIFASVTKQDLYVATLRNLQRVFGKPRRIPVHIW